MIRSGSTARAEPALGTAIALLAAGILLAAGCSQPTDTQPFPGACGPFFPVHWTPEPNAQGVVQNTSIKIVFNDYPDPDTLGGKDLLLWSGIYWHTGSYTVDLIDKAAVFRPSNALRDNLGYTIALFSDVRSLSGCPTTDQSSNFETGRGFDETPPAEPVPFAAVQAILARGCAGAACHRAPAPDQGSAPDGDGGCLPAPAAGLSLCDAEARGALVGVPSRQVSRLRLVAPYDAARSYLMRKLLPGATPAEPVPTTLGHRDPPGAPLPDDELRTIARWIDQGAPE